jgi:hypothetical protein
VYHTVPLQGASMDEFFKTADPLIRFTPSVCETVKLQVTGPSRCLLADDALDSHR